MPESERVERLMTGRRCVYTDYAAIDASNVCLALQDGLNAAVCNHSQEKYLWDYFKGVQEILQRKKDVRPEICNKVVENRAQQVVYFKLGYQLSEPVAYTCPPSGTGGERGERLMAQINELNSLMASEGKDSADRDLFEHMLVTGHGYRMLESCRDQAEEGCAPFELHTLDPWSTFVAYGSSYRHEPVFAVWEGIDPSDKVPVYNVFTKDAYYLVKGSAVLVSSPTTYGDVPIVEYCLNNARMGVFEPVLPLLDAINTVESNRLDGIEQTVQSLMKFVNCDIDEEGFRGLLEMGAIKITSRDGNVADVDILKNELDQSQTQVTKEDLLNAVANIVGMPFQHNRGASTSDTGAAVMMRDGWTMAESHAKGYELHFKAAERRFLRMALGVCRMSGSCDLDLSVRDVEVTFNRRNYENIQTKAQVLTTLLGSEKVAPHLCFEMCGAFADPEAAWEETRVWMEEKAAEEEARAEREAARAARLDNGTSAPAGASDATGQPARQQV